MAYRVHSISEIEEIADSIRDCETTVRQILELMKSERKEEVVTQSDTANRVYIMPLRLWARKALADIKAELQKENLREAARKVGTTRGTKTKK